MLAALLVVDLLWIAAHVCIWIWWETLDAAVLPDEYRRALRLLRFHYGTVAFIVYFLKGGGGDTIGRKSSSSKTDFHVASFITLFLLLYTEAENMTRVVRRVDRISNHDAWVTLLIMSSIAAAVTVLVTLWFVAHFVGETVGDNDSSSSSSKKPKIHARLTPTVY